MKKKGISLIVLIITIIVVIILAAVVILTLSKNNPIESAKEARFKEDVRTFQDELALTVSKQYTSEGGHRDIKISTSDFDEIKEHIPSFSEKYKDKFVIEEDELKYINLTEEEKKWCNDLYIKKGISYKKIEYIKSTREQYIDTNVIPKLNPKVELEVSFDGSYNHKDIAIFGCVDDSSKFSINFSATGSTTLYPWTDKSSSLNNFNISNSVLTNRNLLILTSGHVKYGDVEHVSAVKQDESTSSIILFGRKDARNNKEKIGIFTTYEMKLYSCKIYENEIIIRDYIPVLDENNKPALYDKVEGKFYYNQGTGEDFKYKLKE